MRVLPVTLPRLPLQLLLPLLLLLLLTCCAEQEEGCLDIEATNFNAAADKSCCCTYPSLNFEILHRFDTLVWKPDTAYSYAPGKWFRMKSIVFYLSGFQLTQNNFDIPVSDTLGFKAWGSAGDTISQTLTNDFLLVRRTATAYKAGTFRPSGEFTDLQFGLGLPAEAQEVIPALAPSGHPLRLQGENLWLGRDTGFVALKLVLTRDSLSSTPPDTLVFSRPDFEQLVIKKSGLFQHQSGYNFDLTLTLDYRELFRDVDLSAGSISALKTQIIANLPQVFRVSQ
ncbi:MAG: hypothetical protein IT260_11700 [Saprospiraceae bacterium]|nr:hypothetical protein [Saprospiraceae bacterium]